MVSDLQRLTFVQKALRSAAETATTTKLVAAKTHWHYLVENGVIVAPAEAKAEGIDFRLLQSAKGTNQPPAGPPLLIIPLYEEDQAISVALLPLISKQRVTAMFRGACNTIFMWPTRDQESEFVRGTTLIHEAGHAHKAFVEKRLFRELVGRGPRPEWLLREEAELNLLTARLWKEKGGAAYGALLEQAVQQLAPHLIEPSYAVSPPLPDWLRTMDQIFGPIPPSEEGNRWGHFWIYAHFEYLERSPWSTFHRDCVDLMRTIYAHNQV